MNHSGSSKFEVLASATAEISPQKNQHRCNHRHHANCSNINSKQYYHHHDYYHPSSTSSFSSSLLNQINRSIDRQNNMTTTATAVSNSTKDPSFFRENSKYNTTPTLPPPLPPTHRGGKCRVADISTTTTTTTTTTTMPLSDKDDNMPRRLRRSSDVIDEWVDKKVIVNEKKLVALPQALRQPPLSYKKSNPTAAHHHHRRNEDQSEQQDASVFFSNTSSSSDSSLGGFSSSESTNDQPSSVFQPPPPSSKSRASCFAPPSWPKPVRTCILPKPPTTTKTTQHCSDPRIAGSRTKFWCQSDGRDEEEDHYVKSKSRALSFYSQLKNLKQPVSPGMRLTNFINSLLFDNSKKTKKKKSNGSSNKTKATATGGSNTKGNFIADTNSSYDKDTRLNYTKYSDEDRVGDKKKTKTMASSLPSSPRSSTRPRFINKNNTNNHTSTADLPPKSPGPTVTNHKDTISSRRMMSSDKQYAREVERNTYINNMKYGSECDEAVGLELLVNGYNWDDCDYDVGQKCQYSYSTTATAANCRGNATSVAADEDDDVLSCSSSDLFEIDHLSLIGEDLQLSGL